MRNYLLLTPGPLSTSETVREAMLHGSGTYGVEATIGACVRSSGKLLVVANGAYGKRMAALAPVTAGIPKTMRY